MSDEQQETPAPEPAPSRSERVSEMAEASKFAEGWRGINIVQSAPVTGLVPEPGGLPPAEPPPTPTNSVEAAPPAPPPEQGE